MKLSTTKTADTEAIRIFSLPEGLPFAISQRSFKLTDRLGTSESMRDKIRTNRNESRLRDYFDPGGGSSGSTTVDKTKTTGEAVADGGSGGSRVIRTMSVGIVGIYYVYSFDGRLLAEYDGYGVCLREYVYIGAKIVAEYQPVENKYYYYTTDQINSTRVVTNDLGNVVYAAAHDPYGAMQQTWTNAFNPELKYSGKEKDAESGLYYFGARYYDPTLYRFLSPDPVIQPQLGMANPQFWNLCSYCGNNPISYFDKDGRSFLIFLGSAELLFIFDGKGNLRGLYCASGKPYDDEITRYREGCWRFIRYIPHEGAGRGDGIDDTGFFSFDAPANPPGSRGIHAGRWVWWWVTAGCIRTEREAMQLMRSLNEGGDKMQFLIVTWDSMFDNNGFFDLSGILSKIDFWLRAGGHGERFIKRVLDQVETTLWLIFGPFDFMYDYWFNSESPIPPAAR